MKRSVRTALVCLLPFSALPGSGCARPEAKPVETVDTRFLRDYSETRGFSSGRPAGITLTPDGKAVLFLRSGPRDVVRNLYEMEVATGAVREVIKAEDILKGAEEQLSPEEKARRERMRMSARGFAWFTLSEDGAKLLVGLGGKLYLVNRADAQFFELPGNPAGPALDARFSPDGRFVSCVRNHDLYVTNLGTMTESTVTLGGNELVSHGEAEFVAQEEMDRHTGYWWSGDSQWIAFEECDQRDVERLYIADARNPEAAPQSWRYPRAGRANARVRLGIVSVTGGAPTWVPWDTNRYPYLAAVHWGKDAPLTIYVQNREQREAVLYLVDPITGSTTELVRETDPAWINIDADMPRWLADGSQFLWTTERSGRWQIELRNRDGSLARILPTRDLQLRGVVDVDSKRREVIVAASDDPTQSHLYRIHLDTGDIVALTEGRGVHSGVFSKNGDTWVQSSSLLEGASQQVLRGRDAAILGTLPSAAEEPPFLPNLELTTVEANGQTFHAAVVRPRNFDRSKKYPVIDSVYGGPHANVVSAAARGYLRQQWMADQGFIVVSIDGRGTMHRGREWERAIAGNLIDIPLADQAAALQALGARYPEMDMHRVGITGWSFGGYFSAMAVLKRPEIFHAAVAGAPVIDWWDYDTHYTERYMGLPDANPEGYRVCSALSHADQLSRPLLLIHGTTDDNVYFTHTLKMTEALFKAGRPFDLLVLPGFTHMVPDPLVTMREYERVIRFFQKNLPPRSQSETPPSPAERPG